jgi:hypothetical protein
MTISSTALILSKDDVEHPVKLIFYFPMGAHRLIETSRIDIETAKVVATFNA